MRLLAASLSPGAHAPCGPGARVASRARGARPARLRSAGASVRKGSLAGKRLLSHRVRQSRSVPSAHIATPGSEIAYAAHESHRRHASSVGTPCGMCVQGELSQAYTMGEDVIIIKMVIVKMMDFREDWCNLSFWIAQIICCKLLLKQLKNSAIYSVFL